jgi:predicted dehydrogenase
MSKQPIRNGLEIGRRAFLQGAAALAAPCIVPSWVLGREGQTAPSQRITVGLIGHGAMGHGHLLRLAGDPEVQVLAVCDVDRLRREEAQRRVEETYAAGRAAGTYHGCAAYNDYRELLARSDIDAVVIATPDHWHTPQAIDAAKAGKDIYCEKPVSVTIREGRRLVETVRTYGRVFQTGTQYRSIPKIRAVCEFVRAGGLGKIKAVFTLWQNMAWIAERFQPYAKLLDVERTVASPVPVNLYLPAEPLPDGLDWDLWVGPAPWQPYHPLYHTNPSPGVVPWGFAEAFGTASVTWFHSHAADVIQYALGMDNSGPVEIIHPGSGRFPTLTCRYGNGVLLHHVQDWKQVIELYKAVPAGARLAGNFGGVFVGERGWLTSMTTGGRLEGEPEQLFHEMNLKDREVTLANGHHANWLDCIRQRTAPSASEELGHRAASLGHLVIIAHQLQRSLTWDPAKEEFSGDEEANRLRARAMREPWYG